MTRGLPFAAAPVVRLRVTRAGRVGLEAPGWRAVFASWRLALFVLGADPAGDCSVRVRPAWPLARRVP